MNLMTNSTGAFVADGHNLVLTVGIEPTSFRLQRITMTTSAKSGKKVWMLAGVYLRVGISRPSLSEPLDHPNLDHAPGVEPGSQGLQSCVSPSDSTWLKSGWGSGNRTHMMPRFRCEWPAISPFPNKNCVASTISESSLRTRQRVRYNVLAKWWSRGESNPRLRGANASSSR